MEHVDVGGTQIAYTRAGSGPPLVMVHGAPADSRTWQWMLPDLARDHTVIAWDTPGFGQSSDIDDTWRAAEFADALAAFIVTLDLERPHLVGHSFGTMVALSCFQRHPAAPASLVLIGGYAGLGRVSATRGGGKTARDVPRHGRPGRCVRPEVLPGSVHGPHTGRPRPGAGHDDA